METDPVWNWQTRNLPASQRMQFDPPCTPDVTLDVQRHTAWHARPFGFHGPDAFRRLQAGG